MTRRMTNHNKSCAILVDRVGTMRLYLQIISTSFLILSLLGFPLAVQAQSGDALALAVCMQDKTEASDEQAFKRFLVAALQEQQNNVKAEFSNFASSMIRLALECDVALEDFERPWVEQALGLYGQRVGERIMMDAMAKAGIMGAGD
jgi:hypothetical protein